MTYPGQPGQYGQQPQPNWQQQPQWQPGPYGQQQQPQWQQGGWPQPGQFGPPPPRSRTGLSVGLTIGAVAVVAFAVTAFAWPGFLVGGEDSTPASGGGVGGQAANCQKPDDSGDDGSEAYAQAIVDCINAKNKSVLESLTCGGNSETRRLIDNVDRISEATLTRTFTVSDTEARAVIEATNDGRSGGFQAVLTKSGKAWCWKRMDAANAR